MSKPRPGRLVTVRVTPAVAAKLEAARRKARAFNKGIDAAVAAVTALMNDGGHGDPLTHGILMSVARRIAKLRKPD